MITVHPVGDGGKNRIRVAAAAATVVATVVAVAVAVAVWISNWLRCWSGPAPPPTFDLRILGVMEGIPSQIDNVWGASGAGEFAAR